MNAQAQMLIETARKHVGVKESPPNSNNVIFNTLYYGRAVSGSDYPWCCAFVWCIFREAGLSELFYAGAKTAHCATLMAYGKKNGLFHTSDFRPGDLALFDWSGKKTNAQHIGIIAEVKPASVVTIEGNTAVGNDSNGGEVMERTRALPLIIGVYRPQYLEDEEMDINSIKNELTNLSDTGADHSGWSADAIASLTAMGIFSGDGNGNYGWNQLVTREALAQVIFNLIKIQNEKE